MGIPKLIREIRRLRPLSSSFSPSRSIHFRIPNSLVSPVNRCNNYSNFRDGLHNESYANPILFPGFIPCRSFSIHGSISDTENEGLQIVRDHATESEVLNLGVGSTEAAEGIFTGDGLFFPVRAVISLLDGCHELTGLPWWIVIASSTLALRITLLPLLILQLQKLKRISELFPKLPPPLPPPFSGRTFKEQLSLFQKEKRALGCPSYLWFLASLSVQIPCFLLWMTSIRRMSLDHYPGFDCGGALWFQNLSELPTGVLGSVLPILIAGLHFTNVQISFRTAAVGKDNGLLGVLAKYYKLYLNILTLPLFVIGLCIPQGSLVYWVTNSSLTLIQQLSLNHPAIRHKLGLPDKSAPVASDLSGNFSTPETKSSVGQPEHQISVQNLSPKELLALSVQLLAKGLTDRATPLLRLALEKDPEYVRALVLLGQTLLQKELMIEASEYLERAISKLFLLGDSKTVEEVDLLILASSWAGVTCIRQGKTMEGLEHLQRIAELGEPEDPHGKAHYFEGLLLLSSALFNEGRKVEAEKYLRMAAAFNPAYNVYLEQLLTEENNDGNIASIQRDR